MHESGGQFSHPGRSVIGVSKEEIDRCLSNHSIELSTRNVIARKRTCLRSVVGDMVRESGLSYNRAVDISADTRPSVRRWGFGFAMCRGRQFSHPWDCRWFKGDTIDGCLSNHLIELLTTQRGTLWLRLATSSPATCRPPGATYNLQQMGYCRVKYRHRLGGTPCSISVRESPKGILSNVHEKRI
jgi:hypothetical protein